MTKETLEVEKLKCNGETPAHINYTEEQLRALTHGGKSFNICSMSIAKTGRILSKYTPSRSSSTFQTAVQQTVQPVLENQFCFNFFFNVEIN